VVEKLFENPTYTTIFVLLSIAVTAFFLNKIHPVAPCKEARDKERADMADQLKKAEERAVKAESREEKQRDMLWKLIGSMEEIPEILRRSKE
jgi:hypothetical protein